MKVLMCYQLATVLDIQETADGNAIIQMGEPKVCEQYLMPMVTDENEFNDLCVIARAHALEWAAKKALEIRSEIGEGYVSIPINTHGGDA